MKRILLIVGALALLAVMGFGAWLLLPKNEPQEPSNGKPSSVLPPSGGTGVIVRPGTPLIRPGTEPQPVVASDFSKQIDNPGLITLGSTMVVENYALQSWYDENKGGEALLYYTPSQGWKLISMGGGAWDMSSLVDAGVPEVVAARFVATQ